MKRMSELPTSPFDSLTWGFVYLLKVNDSYKIGITTNLRSRVKAINRELQKGRKPKATVVYYFIARDASKTEACLHKMFNSKRTERQTYRTFSQEVRGNNESEWFSLTESDVTYIKTLANEV